MTLTKRFSQWKWMILLALWMVTSLGSSQAPATNLDTPREAFLTCVKKSTTLLLQIDGANPPGIAYLTGLSCSYQREAYHQALISAGFPHVNQMMNRVDVAVTLYMRNAWAAQHPQAAAH
jgi:hypothetical protein